MKEDGEDSGFLRKADIDIDRTIVHIFIFDNYKEETAHFFDDRKFYHETESGARQHQMKKKVQVDH